MKYCPFMSYRGQTRYGIYCFESKCPLYQDGCLVVKALLKYIGEEEKSKELEEKINEMKKDISMARLGFPVMELKND